MNKDTSNMVIGGLALLVIVFGWLWLSDAKQVRDYRSALDEANTVIDQSHSEIEGAQSESDSADFDQLHALISGLTVPETVSDPHPPSSE